MGSADLLPPTRSPQAPPESRARDTLDPLYGGKRARSDPITLSPRRGTHQGFITNIQNYRYNGLNFHVQYQLHWRQVKSYPARRTNEQLAANFCGVITLICLERTSACASATSTPKSHALPAVTREESAYKRRIAVTSGRKNPNPKRCKDDEKHVRIYDSFQSNRNGPRTRPRLIRLASSFRNLNMIGTSMSRRD